MKPSALVLFAMLAPAAPAATLPPSSAGVSVRVDPATGTYSVSCTAPAFTLKGSLTQRLAGLRAVPGRDGIGAYDELAFGWTDGGAPLRASIRRYRDRPLALFSWATPGRLEQPPAPFPTLAPPAGLHSFSYEDRNFSPPRFQRQPGGTPWLLFDNQARSVIVSPADNFMVARMFTGPGDAVASGLNTELRGLPAGFGHRTLVAFAGGINAAWEVWGHGLSDFLGRKRPSNQADPFLKYLGYWTDNGAGYYYSYEKDLGYEGTLLAVARDLKQRGIPIRYMQLDSWWYQKTTTDYRGRDDGKPKRADLPAGTWNAYGGLTTYRAHPFVFPDDLAGFQKRLGMPLATHNRWVDVASPYRQQYEIPGLAATDQRWWDDVTGYLRTGDVRLYEQDWLNYIYEYSPRFRSEPYTASRFLDAMAKACADRGMTMQYCMVLPRYHMQGARYSNLTNARTSDDRFNRGQWQRFLYVSRLVSALGTWPWVDVFYSRERDNLLLSVLSAGLVGIGDKIGEGDAANIRRAVRADGVIVKPDAAIVPVDSAYLADAGNAAKPLVAATHTDHGARRTTYVFAYGRKPEQTDVRFSPAGLGVAGPSVVWDHFGRTAHRVPAGGEFTASLKPGGQAYYEVAPMGASGIAFLGDDGLFVGTGKARIPTIAERPGTLTATVEFAAGETDVVLHLWAPRRPEVAVRGAALAGVAAADHEGSAGRYTATIRRTKGAGRATVTFTLR